MKSKIKFSKKNKFNKNLILIFVLIFSIFSKYNTIYAQPSDLSCEAACLIENDTGEILFGKNQNEKIYPASTTKIMTGILAIENLDLNRTITVPDDFPFVDGSSMYLVKGEKFKAKELIQSLLIHSSNDVAVLLATTIAGNVDNFVDMMNEKAKKIGARNTHFANPHGLHDDNHYSTAYDMALISRYAMKNPFFRQTVKKEGLTLHETEKTKEKRIYFNTNRFLWSKSEIIYKNQYIPIKYDIVDGIKTGYTLEAKNCLVSTAKKNNMRLILATYKSNGFEVYRDSREILDYGFDNYSVENIYLKNQVIGSKKIKRSVEKILKYGAKENISAVSKIGERNDVEVDIKLDDLKLPIKKGEKVGEIDTTINGVGKVYNLYAKNDVESIFTIKHIKSIFSFENIKNNKKNIIRIILLIVIILIIRFIKNNKRRRRRRRYRRLK